MGRGGEGRGGSPLSWIRARGFSARISRLATEHDHYARLRSPDIDPRSLFSYSGTRVGFFFFQSRFLYFFFCFVFIFSCLESRMDKIIMVK